MNNKTPGKLINTVINFVDLYWRRFIKPPSLVWEKNIYSLPVKNDNRDKISELEDKKENLRGR